MKNYLSLRNLNEKKKQKLSDFIFDIVKYMITAQLLAFMFSNFNSWPWYDYVIVLLMVLVLLVFAFKLLDD